jgi:hypothetical protein
MVRFSFAEGAALELSASSQLVSFGICKSHGFYRLPLQVHLDAPYHLSCCISLTVPPEHRGKGNTAVRFGGGFCADQWSCTLSIFIDAGDAGEHSIPVVFRLTRRENNECDERIGELTLHWRTLPQLQYEKLVQDPALFESGDIVPESPQSSSGSGGCSSDAKSAAIERRRSMFVLVDDFKDVKPPPNNLTVSSGPPVTRRSSRGSSHAPCLLGKVLCLKDVHRTTVSSPLYNSFADREYAISLDFPRSIWPQNLHHAPAIPGLMLDQHPLAGSGDWGSSCSILEAPFYKGRSAAREASSSTDSRSRVSWADEPATKSSSSGSRSMHRRQESLSNDFVSEDSDVAGQNTPPDRHELHRAWMQRARVQSGIQSGLVLDDDRADAGGLRLSQRLQRLQDHRTSSQSHSRNTSFSSDEFGFDAADGENAVVPSSDDDEYDFSDDSNPADSAAQESLHHRNDREDSLEEMLQHEFEPHSLTSNPSIILNSSPSDSDPPQVLRTPITGKSSITPSPVSSAASRRNSHPVRIHRRRIQPHAVIPMAPVGSMSTSTARSGLLAANQSPLVQMAAHVQAHLSNLGGPPTERTPSGVSSSGAGQRSNTNTPAPQIAEDRSINEDELAASFHCMAKRRRSIAAMGDAAVLFDMTMACEHQKFVAAADELIPMFQGSAARHEELSAFWVDDASFDPRLVARANGEVLLGNTELQT